MGYHSQGIGTLNIFTKAWNVRYWADLSFQLCQILEIPERFVFRSCSSLTRSGFDDWNLAKWTRKDVFKVVPFLNPFENSFFWKSLKQSCSCGGQFQVLNIDEVNFGPWIDDFNFTTHHDHSKWAISFETAASSKRMSKVVCIGDINRMKTQMKRAGGTVCFENPEVWKAYSGLVKSVESCPLMMKI